MTAESVQSSLRPSIDIQRGKNTAHPRRKVAGVSPDAPFYGAIDPIEARQEKIRKELIKRVDKELKEPPLGHAVAARAYNEITADDVQLTPESQYHDVINQLHSKGHMWNRDDDLTKAYVESAIDRAKLSPDEWAYRELSGYGVDVSATDTEETIRNKLKEKGQFWKEHDEATDQYLKEAIEFAKKPKEELSLHAIAESGEVVTEQDGEAGKKEEEPESINMGVKFLIPELRPDDSRSVYLDPQTIEKSGVHEGDRIWVTTDKRTTWVYVRTAMRRDDGSVEDINSPYLRFSEHVISGNDQDEDGIYRGLGLPKGVEFLESIHNSPIHPGQKEIRLSEVSSPDSSVIKMQEARGVSTIEHHGVQETVYLNKKMQEKLGITSGEKIHVRFGKVRKEVAIIESESEDDANWQLSKDIIDGLGLTDITDVKMRSKFDKDSRELSFGPSIVYTIPGKFPIGGDEAFEAISKQAEEYGAFICLIPNGKKISPLAASRGFINALIFREGNYQNVRVPLPDVISTPAKKVPNSFKALFSHDENPRVYQRAIYDKLRFAQIIEESNLSDFMPKTVPLDMSSPQQLEEFFERHNEVVLKPQRASSGRGIMSIRRNENGSYTGRRGTSDNAEVIELRDIQQVIKYSKTIKRELTGGMSNDMGYIVQEKVPIVDYHYNDPQTGTPLVGKLEPRVFIYRGLDGKAKIGGISMRIQNSASPIPHSEDPQFVMQRLSEQRGDIDPEILLAQLREVSLGVFDIASSAETPREGSALCELTVDLAVTPHGVKIIEANRLGRNRPNFTFSRSGEGEIALSDGLYSTAAGPIESALYLTGFGGMQQKELNKRISAYGELKTLGVDIKGTSDPDKLLQKLHLQFGWEIDKPTRKYIEGAIQYALFKDHGNRRSNISTFPEEEVDQAA